MTTVYLSGTVMAVMLATSVKTARLLVSGSPAVRGPRPSGLGDVELV
jgi:hypothetical protein